MFEYFKYLFQLFIYPDFINYFQMLHTTAIYSGISAYIFSVPFESWLPPRVSFFSIYFFCDPIFIFYCTDFIFYFWIYIIVGVYYKLDYMRTYFHAFLHGVLLMPRTVMEFWHSVFRFKTSFSQSLVSYVMFLRKAMFVRFKTRKSNWLFLSNFLFYFDRSFFYISTYFFTIRRYFRHYFALYNNFTNKFFKLRSYFYPIQFFFYSTLIIVWYYLMYGRDTIFIDLVFNMFYFSIVFFFIRILFFDTRVSFFIKMLFSLRRYYGYATVYLFIFISLAYFFSLKLSAVFCTIFIIFLFFNLLYLYLLYFFSLVINIMLFLYSVLGFVFSILCTFIFFLLYIIYFFSVFFYDKFFF